MLVGTLNTIFGYCIFALFVFLGVHYTLAVLLATFFGVLFNFKTLGRIVFKSSNNRLIIKFFMVYSVLYCINVSLIKELLLLSINTYISGFFATIVCAILSYLLNKNFVFKTKVVA